MCYFKNELNNIAFENGLFNLIINHIYQCSKDMKEACLASGKGLCNDEDKISNRLVNNHLNKNNLRLRFILQSLETFEPNKDEYMGRCDIKVVSENWIKNVKDYFLIECKRIDGGSDLNKKYITEGVSRFVVSKKYPSYHKRNIMFGYIIKSIDISENTLKIDKLQVKILSNISRIRLIKRQNSEFFHYCCDYNINTINNIELAHLFFDFSDVIKK